MGRSFSRANSDCPGITFNRRAASGCAARSSPATCRDEIPKPGVEGAAPIDPWSGCFPPGALSSKELAENYFSQSRLSLRERLSFRGAKGDTYFRPAPEEDGSRGCNNDWCRAVGASGPSGPGVVASRRNQDLGKVLELRKIKLQWSRAASVNDQAHAALLHSRHRFGSGFSIVLSGTFRGEFDTEIVSASLLIALDHNGRDMSHEGPTGGGSRQA